jgi:signal transduction histidine kinase
LSEFISANIEPILAEWETFARSLAPGTSMAKLALRNDAESILRACVLDMQSDQSSAEQASKSKGLGGAGGDDSDHLDNASTLHGVARVGSGFNLVEVVSEYRALRASVLRLWRASKPRADIRDLDDITRFNECIDQSLAKAVASYTHRVDQTRRMFLAILAHDLRNPLNTVSLSAKMASLDRSIQPDSKEMLQQIETSVQAIDRLVSDLTDFASTGLGAAMPIRPAPVNLEALCREVIREIDIAHPSRQIICNVHGDLTLMADAARVRQVLSNLLGNAIQHDDSAHPVSVTLTGESDQVVLLVHNRAPIPASLIPSIFDPLVRGNDSQIRRRHGSIGLGLYIVREIVSAHGGRIELSSCDSDGTTFTVHLPRTAGEKRAEA